MIAAGTPPDRFWAAMMIEEEEVDMAALADVVRRHELEPGVAQVSRWRACRAGEPRAWRDR